MDRFEDVLIKDANISEVYFDEHFPYHMRLIPWYRQVKRMAKYISMD